MIIDMHTHFIPSGFYAAAKKGSDAGSIRGVMDSVLPLDSAEQAYDRMKERNFFGKIILSIP